MKKLLLLLVLALGSVVGQAQEENFLVKGRIFSEDSLKAIPNVNIISELSTYGTITNNDGWFLIKSKIIDTLWVSCVGFERQRVPVDKDNLSGKELIIKLIRKDIVLDSVEIYPLPDYRTFVNDFANMPLKKPFYIPGVSKEGDEKIIYQEPVREPKASSINPITLIYNRFNKRERFKRKLERNRRRFNREMERIDADSLMIPERE